MQPVLPLPRHQRRTTPGDLRTTERRANCGLLVLIPDQGPPQRLTPEVANLLRTVARKRADESALGKEGVPWLDDAELVALGVGENDVSLLRALTDIDVPGAEFQRPRHRLPLVLRRRARQVEVHPVLADFLLLRRKKAELETGVVGGQKGDAAVRIVGRLPVQDPG